MRDETLSVPEYPIKFKKKEKVPNHSSAFQPPPPSLTPDSLLLSPPRLPPHFSPAAPGAGFWSRAPRPAIIAGEAFFAAEGFDAESGVPSVFIGYIWRFRRYGPELSVLGGGIGVFLSAGIGTSRSESPALLLALPGVSNILRLFAQKTKSGSACFLFRFWWNGGV